VPAAWLYSIQPIGFNLPGLGVGLFVSWADARGPLFAFFN
jgi:hypothetical protein